MPPDQSPARAGNVFIIKQIECVVFPAPSEDGTAWAKYSSLYPDERLNECTLSCTLLAEPRTCFVAIQVPA